MASDDYLTARQIFESFKDSILENFTSRVHFNDMGRNLNRPEVLKVKFVDRFHSLIWQKPVLASNTVKILTRANTGIIS